MNNRDIILQTMDFLKEKEENTNIGEFWDELGLDNSKQNDILDIILRYHFAIQDTGSVYQLRITESGKNLNEYLLNDIANFYDGFPIVTEAFKDISNSDLLQYEKYFRRKLEDQKDKANKMKELLHRGLETVGISKYSYSYEDAQVGFIELRVKQIDDEIKLRSMQEKTTVINANNSAVSVISNSPNSTVYQKVVNKTERDNSIDLLNTILSHFNEQQHSERELVSQMLDIISKGEKPDQSLLERLLSISANITTVAAPVHQFLQLYGFVH